MIADAEKRKLFRSSRQRLLGGLLLITSAGAALAQTEPQAAPAPPDSPAPPVIAAIQRRVPGLSLKRCLELAERNYPKIHEARARLAVKRAQLDQAHYTPYSDFTVTGGLGLAPSVRGTNVYSPNSDVPLTPEMRPAWQMGIEGLIPLWTFGKISNLWDAAEAQVKVGEHELQKEKNQLRFDVRRAYYGVRLARDALALVKDGIQRLDKYIPDLEKKVAAGEGDDIELLKVRMNRAELDARESEARKQEAIALSGLRFLTGLGEIIVPDLPLKRATHRLGPLTHYLSAAKLYRPEVNMAKAGVLAREAQVRLERARYLPDIGLGLSARWSSAPSVTDQTNPFIKDPNFLSYGIGLVLRYKLDFLPQSSRVEQAEAQLEEIRATERFALGGVGWEVEQAFREAEDATRRLDAYTRATGYARQWLVKVQQGIEVGTFEDEDIVDPAKEYALKRFAQMSALFDYNVSLARLAQVTGWDTVAGDG